MTYYFIFVVTVIVVFLKANAAAAGDFFQVEGMVLGYMPAIADGVRVSPAGREQLTFTPAHRCLDSIEVQPVGLPGSGNGNGISFSAEDRQIVRNKLSGLVGYPGVAREDEWLRTATGLSSDFYRENLIAEVPGNMIQLLYVPMVLSPRPVTIVKTDWTPKAKEILAKEGWAGLERFCGTHFVQSIGEESFIIYSVKVNFSSAGERMRYERIRNDAANLSPTMVLNSLYRMSQRFEYAGPGREVVLDVLQVGGRDRDINRLREELGTQNSVQIEVESRSGSAITRARMTCKYDGIEPCQKMAQLFSDFQFRRLNFNGERPAFMPVRFRIAPLAFAATLNH